MQKKLYVWKPRSCAVKLNIGSDHRKVGPRLLLPDPFGGDYGIPCGIGRSLRFFEGFSGVEERPPNEEYANNRESERYPCGLFHPSGRIRHALLGCQIAPVWFVAFGAISIIGLWIGGRSLIALEDRRWLAGSLGLLTAALLLGIGIGVGGGFF
jgi:hypothetical protein